MKRLNDNNLVIFDPLDQSSPEWLEWRNKGIGSSDVAVLMSPKPVFDRTVGTLWKQKIGYERAVALDNEHIKRGKELEPEICAMVNEMLGAKFEPACIYRKDAPYLRASLDGFDESLDCILEIKAPSDNVYAKYLKTWEIPQNYYEQMQYQMLVADVEYGYFAFYNQQASHPYIIKVENNLEVQLEIEKRCHLFWRSVQTKTPLGWDGDRLKMFHQKPSLVILVGNVDQQIEWLAKECELTKVLVNQQKHEGSGVMFLPVQRLDSMPQIKDVYFDHDIKIINLTPSPFGAGGEVDLADVPELIRKELSASALPLEEYMALS